MRKTRLNERELRKLLAGELRSAGAHDIDPEALVILPKPAGWWATISTLGPRLDEALLAAVGEAGQRLSAGFDLAV